MRVKRYVSETLQDAMLKVKMDMGKDAVILHTRKFKEGGFFGFFGKLMFEVTAAIEDVPNLPVTSSKHLVAVTADPAAVKKKAQIDVVVKDEMTDGKTEKVDEQASPSFAEIHEEIQDMKQMINDMKIQIEASEELRNLPKYLQKYHQLLMDNEVDEKIIRKIIKDLNSQIPKEKVSNGEFVEEMVIQQILKYLKRPKPISFKRQGLNQKSIALVGPTGVGKTTTIAKLAATFSIVDKKNIALITADTYRVAAVEQLKTYGEIIGVPVDVVFSPTELQEAINRHMDKDLILIDTAGRSHKNEEQMDELKSFLSVAEPSEIFLVLSATTRYKDMTDIVDRYADIPINRLIFTKLDETSCVGAILNITFKTQKSLSYVTVGQNVPDDIEVADPLKIAKMIARER